ncbi:DUF2871 domain-containing protein [Nocardia tengchongensis]|uniref:DUF2871 domain-containing protein n=1 Tax=Nocardia tengchongensis TaxID=2055889 RepID=UPI00369992EA
MKKAYFAAAVYTLAGLGLGFYHREFTKAHEFTGPTQLTATHTHVLALGTLFFLIVIALDKQFAFSGTRLFSGFFWTYNLGLVLTVAMMVVHGSLTVLGHAAGPAISGVAGLGHIVLTVGFALFFGCLYGPVIHAPETEHATGSTRSHIASGDQR